MENDTHWQMRLEAALFGTASAHTPRDLEQIARQAEDLRDAHDATVRSIRAADGYALPTLSNQPQRSGCT